MANLVELGATGIEVIWWISPLPEGVVIDPYTHENTEIVVITPDSRRWYTDAILIDTPGFEHLGRVSIVVDAQILGSYKFELYKQTDRMLNLVGKQSFKVVELADRVETTIPYF